MWQVNVSMIDSDWTVRSSGSGQVCTGTCCCEGGRIRARVVPGRRQTCSAQTFSCGALPGVSLARPRSHSTDLLITPGGTSGRCITVLPPSLCGVALEILQSLEWRNNRNPCLLSASPYEKPLLGCWKVISNRILLSTEIRLLLISSMNRRDTVTCFTM